MTAPREPTPLTDETALLPDPETMTHFERYRHLDRASLAYLNGHVSLETYREVSQKYGTDWGQVFMGIARHQMQRERQARPWWRRWLP